MEGVTLEKSQNCFRLFNKADPRVVLVEHLLSASNPLNPSVLIHGMVRYPV